MQFKSHVTKVHMQVKSGIRKERIVCCLNNCSLYSFLIAGIIIAIWSRSWVIVQPRRPVMPVHLLKYDRTRWTIISVFKRILPVWGGHISGLSCGCLASFGGNRFCSSYFLNLLLHQWQWSVWYEGGEVKLCRREHFIKDARTLNGTANSSTLSQRH